jgi:TonB family protein
MSSCRFSVLAFALLAVMAAGPAWAQDTGPQRPVPAVPPAAPAPLTPPKLLHFETAPYPPEAKQKGLAGQVDLLLSIDATGAVSQAVVTAPAGHGFDEAAVEAARKFRFAPAERGGQKVPVRIRYRYRFTLEPPKPPPASSPAPAPTPGPPQPAGTAQLSGRVLERGTRIPNAGVEVSVSPALGSPGVAGQAG